MQALTEHVLKSRLAARGARVPRGVVVTAPDAARGAADRLGGRVVVKSLVARKDRAAAGLVRLVPTAGEAAAAAADMLAAEPGSPLLVEETAPAGDEHYLALAFDLLAGTAVVLHGPGGSGVETRSAPRRTPVALDEPLPAGVVPAALLPVARAMFAEFQELRAHVLEVNPVRVVDGTAWVLDAKAVLDPAAPVPAEAVAVGVPDPVEVRLRAEAAALKGGTEVRFGCLAGDVGVVSAGGGVLTLLNDALARHGLEPANFSDVSGGSATTRILGSVAREVAGLHPRAVLVMTGITSSVPVVEFARTMRAALAPLAGRSVPVVARMAGTGEEEAVAVLGDLPRCRVVGKDTTVEECVALLAAMLEEAA